MIPSGGGTRARWALFAVATLAGCGGLVEGVASPGAGAADGDVPDAADGPLGATQSAHPGPTSLDAAADVGSSFPDAACVVAGPFGFSSPSGTCPPAPADDHLFFASDSVSVPAGGWGAPTVIATGPWAEDPAHPVYIGFSSFSLETTDVPYVPVSIEPGAEVMFLMPLDSVGEHGTLKVFGTNGPVTTTASVSVTVTTCAPWSLEEACGGAACGEAENGCGGMVSCGSCGESAPYCFAGLPPYGARCIACEPMQCSWGEGFDDKSCTCISCGSCLALDNVCACKTGEPWPPSMP
jgi:hypothetical protein